MGLRIYRSKGERVLVHHQGQTLEITAQPRKDGSLKLWFSGPEEFEVRREEWEGGRRRDRNDQ